MSINSGTRDASKNEKPLIRFETELSNFRRVNDLNQNGLNLLTVYLSVLSNLGGMTLPINIIGMAIVSYIVNPAFISELTKNIFLISRFNEDVAKQASSETYRIARKYPHYVALKENLEKRKISKQDINNIVDGMYEDRYTVTQATKEPNFYLYAFFKPCLCCKMTQKEKFNLKRLEEAERKFNKVLDFRNVMKTLQNAKILI